MVGAHIIADVTSLQVNVAAAAPLGAQTQIAIEALQSQGSSLLQEVDAAIVATGGPLDASDPTGFAGDMVAVLSGLATASEDQTTLTDMRGLVGRAMFNLAQVSP